jgi:hypothetical protein
VIDVTDRWWLAIVVAGLAGMAGGLIYELLQARSTAADSTGQVETPHRGGASLLDLGLFASMLIGATAAVAFCFFNPPQELTTLTNGTSTTTRQYDALHLVALSLIVGSAGSSFFAAMQDKVRAALNAQSLELLVATHDDATTRIKELGQPGEAAVAIAETVNDLAGHALAVSRQERLRQIRGARRFKPSTNAPAGPTADPPED